MTLFMDSTARSVAGGPFGVIAEDGENFVFTGTTVYSMERSDNNSTYRDYARYSDVNFIFDDAVPQVDFYAVPRLDIFALDSNGGFFATYGEVTDIDSDAPITYVDKSKNCYIVADNLKAFIGILDASSRWQDNMKPVCDIVFYPSRESAMQSLDFIAIPDDFLQTP